MIAHFYPNLSTFTKMFYIFAPRKPKTERAQKGRMATAVATHQANRDCKDTDFLALFPQIPKKCTRIVANCTEFHKIAHKSTKRQNIKRHKT